MCGVGDPESTTELPSCTRAAAGPSSQCAHQGGHRPPGCTPAPPYAGQSWPSAALQTEGGRTLEGNSSRRKAQRCLSRGGARGCSEARWRWSELQGEERGAAGRGERGTDADADVDNCLRDLLFFFACDETYQISRVRYVDASLLFWTRAGTDKPAPGGCLAASISKSVDSSIRRVTCLLDLQRFRAASVM
jgi:hypothetical protein